MQGGGDTETIPRNDAGRLVAVSIALITASKLVEKVASLLKRKRTDKTVSKQGIVWSGHEGQTYAYMLASGVDTSISEEPKDQQESIWQVTRIMEKRAMKEAHDRQYAYCKMTFSRTTKKQPPPPNDDIDLGNEDEAAKQVVPQAQARPMPRFSGMPGMGF